MRLRPDNLIIILLYRWRQVFHYPAFQQSYRKIGSILIILIGNIQTNQFLSFE